MKMMVVAHPDDETVGGSTLLPQLAQALFVYVTDGAPRSGSDAARLGWSVDAYREARRRERADVFRLCGIDALRIVEFGAPAQEAAFALAAFARELAALLDRHAVDEVFTHPYEGGHPDHDATAFIVHAAAQLASRRPAITEMASYHRGPRGLVAGEFLPHAAADAQGRTVALSHAQRAFKQSLVDAYASQRDTLRRLPVAAERFRPAPRYDFARRPHAGPLWYEGRGWPVSGDRFCRLAADALHELGIAAQR
jgi:LmbE family N-acetylglucosaminyl deacetylase